MDIDTIRYLREMMAKGDHEAALRIVDAAIEEHDNPPEEEDEGHEQEAIADRHSYNMHGDSENDESNANYRRIQRAEDGHPE